MSEIMKQLKTFYTFFVPVERGLASRNEDMRSAEANDEEDFTYTTTRCLSSYYSIFVARLAIMIMLAILIGMLTILTWHFTRVYTINSINSLAYGLRYELLQRPVLRMWNILNSTVEITMAQVKLSEYVIDRYDSPVTQEEQMKLYQMMKDITWAVFASRKALDAITISYTNGFVQAFHRNHRNNATFYIYSDLVFTSYQNLTQQSGRDFPSNVSAIWYGEPLDPDTGDKTGNRRRIPPDELINIAGLPEVRDGAASWRIAVSKFSDSPLLSAALPVRHPSNGSIVAVVGVTTALKSVSQLMKELVGIHSGCMYLTTREGNVLATSTDTPLLRNTSVGLKLVMANESDNGIIKSGAEWLQKAYGDKFPISHEVHDDNVMLERKNYYIDSFFLNLRRLPLPVMLYWQNNTANKVTQQTIAYQKWVMGNVGMVGVIIIPRKSIMGKVDEIAFTTLVILILLSICILAIGCICIFILTSGVSKAMKLRAELISHLDARRRAEASSNYKSQFLANMSHELRTPMAAVIGLLDILTYDGCLTNEQLATVTQIRKCSTALLRLLNNILDLSKVESGKLVLEEVEFDLGRELEGLADMFSVQCINHNVEIILDLSDDLPRKVKGDLARVVQIFTNLISNSIKFTLEGHVILRGWLQGVNESNPNESHKRRSRQDESDEDRDCNKDRKITLWFEVEDTGCGIDPSKWESVFESFEQADPSTTRKHGGTGLGLCIVRNLINKMGGEIKVAKKEGPGTLMRLYMVLGMPDGGTEKHIQAEFKEHSLAVLLALKGSKGRYLISQWLKMKGVFTWEASEWNKLTQILQELFKDSSKISQNGHSTSLNINQGESANTKSNILIVVDTSLLDQSTNIWNEQLIFLDRYRKKAKFAWILSHNTSNAIKLELQHRGHFLTVNKPLYKTKMIHLLRSLLSDGILEYSPMVEDAHECNEIDPIHFKDISSAESSDNENIDAIKNKGEASVPKQPNGIEKNMTGPKEDKLLELGTCNKICRAHYNHNIDAEGIEASRKVTTNRGALEGVYILLAEDNPILQRVATKMLEKMGATVVAVGDGVQAVDALKCMFKEEARRKNNMCQQENGAVTMKQSQQPEAFHLILMDCQMPKLDGYEATKAIRRLEAGTGSHIPIIAVTAHAMSSDEAKCLEVGMDAYMTKPLDYNLMVSTILAFTQSNG